MFAWSAVAGASYYEFRLSADAGFNSHPLGATYDDFKTKNTRAAVIKPLPDGDYWWRVRAANATGTAGVVAGDVHEDLDRHADADGARR